MTIRTKIILIFLPLLITPIFVTAVVSSLSARNGITRVTTEFLKFKSEELVNYANSQWDLLLDHGFQNDPPLVDAAKTAVESFATSLIRRETEAILAFDDSAETVMQTGELMVEAGERQAIRDLVQSGSTGWHRIRLEGRRRVAYGAVFEPFDWYILVTEHEDTFYATVNRMFWQTGFILTVSALTAVALLLVFSLYLTRPLRHVIAVMKDIIIRNDLSSRVQILYQDETGELGHTFNIMTSELEKAYGHIKGYAIQTAVAQNREQKIRNIFQKYVPNDVIQRFFTNPEAMLVGENRPLAVLYSDIRQFTTISERMESHEIVKSLNAYFERMVEVITRHRGIVDKYIGDALMAFYGAPVQRPDDAYHAVLSGFEMLDRLQAFNAAQRGQRRPAFRIGIGINYGLVTLGNMGCDQKMDYTVVGDMVNVASRLENLTKLYREPLIISHYVYQRVGTRLPCRMLDRVILKGKTKSVGIYLPRSSITPTEERAWELHNRGLRLYYNRDFEEAKKIFVQVQELLPGDVSSQIFIDRCLAYGSISLPEDWDGSVVMSEK